MASSTVDQSVISDVIAYLQSHVDFYNRITKTTQPGWPNWPQAIRMNAFLQKKRILVADDTGINGKTFTAVASKIMLDQERKARGLPNTTALVIAPNSGLENAWSEEDINFYASKLNERAQSVLTINDYKDFSKVRQGVDFVTINWEKLSIKEEDRRWQLIEEAIGIVKPEVFPIDEGHNAKGGRSNRSKSVMRLTQHTLDKYLMILTATPIPNRYRDIGMIFHMMDPIRYPDPVEAANHAPEIIKQLMNGQVWFRLTREDMKEQLGLPDFHSIEHNFRLSDEEARIYFDIWRDCVQLGEGLTELRYAINDARLSKYGKHLDNFTPSLMTQVHDVAGKAKKDGHKVIVKTNLVTGILGPYTEKLKELGGLIVVPASMDLSQRKAAFKKFQHDPNYNILLTTSIAEESVGLTTGERPCTMIPLEPEITPREYLQFTGRAYRRGQKADVFHYNFVAQSELLNRLMREEIQTIAKQYGCKVPRHFVPRTIFEDMIAMRKAKVYIVNKILGGEKITKKEETIYDADLNFLKAANQHLESMVAPSTLKEITPFARATWAQGKWRGIGEESFNHLVSTDAWRQWCKFYEQGWENSASQATLQSIDRLLTQLDDRENLTIGDIGSGAAYFSRATGREAICIDLDKKWLLYGEKHCQQLGISNTYLQASATKTGLPDTSLDAVVNCYMIMYLGQNGKHEVEDCVLETNRIVRPGGHFMLSLPWSAPMQTVERFNNTMPEYGFTPKKMLTPKETKENRMKNGCYVLAFEKEEDVRIPHGKDLTFYPDVRLIG